MTRRNFILRILTAALAALGLVMFISGLALRHWEKSSRRTADPSQMPEEYIEEFFSSSDGAPDILEEIEPEE